MQPERSSWFHDAVSALVYSLASGNVQERSGVPSGMTPPGDEFAALLQPPFNDITRFILHQRAQMPDYLRFPMLAVTLGFDLAGLLRGRLFHSQLPERRGAQMSSWRQGIGLQRDLIRYYESLATLALYSRSLLECGVPQSRELALRPLSGVDQSLGVSNQHASPQLETGVIVSPSPHLRAEIAVIGSGPGGSMTACLLAEAGRNVLLIEEGPFYQLESCHPFSKEEMLQKYRNGGQTVAMGRNKVAYVEARCVGGGSEINSGLYHRTPPERLELWQKEFQLSASREEDLRPHFEACERDLAVSLLPGPAPAASLKLHTGAQRLGWKSLEVPRWFRYSDSNAETGIRQSMTKTLIPRFLKAGGKLLPGTQVNRILQEGSSWTLESVHRPSGAVRIRAETVFVCAGAVQTPALLRRSGITAHIGNSLGLHPTVKVVARFPETVNAPDMGVPVHQVKEFAPRLSFGCSISTPPYLALSLIDHPGATREVRQSWRHMANYYSMVAGQGRGTVRPLPGFGDPLVRYRLPPADRKDLAEGLKKLCEVLFAAGASAVYPTLANTPALTGPEHLRSLPDILPDGAASLMTIHLFSSCPMGEDGSKCATDSFGRVHGLKNLLIADGSLLCTAPGVNPQGSIMAFARRNALHFLNHAT